MAKMHITYREDSFDDALLELTKRFLMEKPWHSNPENVRRLYDTWLHGASIIYNLPVPLLEFGNQPGKVGRYVPQYQAGGTARIYLHKASMISLFHQYRHHMQDCAGEVEGVYKNEDEKAADCQSWATSLLYVVAPRRFRRMVRSGRVAGVGPKDLLKRRSK